jgi:hypothetical protein
MSFDPHERAQFLMDESRIAGISPEESSWLRAHLTDCAECARQEQITAQMLAAMREMSYGAATVKERLPEYHDQPLPYGRGSAAWRWPLAAAAVVLLAAIPLYKAREARQEQADALLLERVSSHVSRTVPQALEPLIHPGPGDRQ